MGDTSHPHSRRAGSMLSGRGRTFAAFLQPGSVVEPNEPPDACAMVFPHRRRVEVELGGRAPSRALLDPGGCAARGVDGYVHAGTACFAESDPPFELALRLAREARVRAAAR